MTAQLELPAAWAKTPYRCQECRDEGVVAVGTDKRIEQALEDMSHLQMRLLDEPPWQDPPHAWGGH